jgi:hypothetical protein
MASWSRRYPNEKYPFVQRRDAGLLSDLLTTCDDDVGRAIEIIDRYLTDDAPSNKRHALNWLINACLPQYTTDQPRITTHGHHRHDAGDVAVA